MFSWREVFPNTIVIDAHFRIGMVILLHMTCSIYILFTFYSTPHYKLVNK